MFNHFTSPAVQALVWARNEAERLNGECIDAEHLLLGLLSTAGRANELLSRENANLAEWREKILKSLEADSQPFTAEQIKFTTRTRTVINRCIAEARGDTHIGTEHLLLALASITDGLVGVVLSDAGVTAHKLRLSLNEYLAGHPASEEEFKSLDFLG